MKRPPPERPLRPLLSSPCRAWRLGRTACYDAVVKITSLEVFVLDLPVKGVFVLAGDVAATSGTLSPRVLVKVMADAVHMP